MIKPDVILHLQDALGLDFAMTVGALSGTTTVEGGAALATYSAGSPAAVPPAGERLD